MADREPIGPHRVPRPIRILVVEDDPQQADVLAAILTDAGFAVTAIRDGLHALYLIDAERPDLVLLDLDVPRVSGFRLIHLLKRDPSTASVPVLVLTALDFSEAKEAVQEGADAFLGKPFDLDDLVGRVRQLVRQTAAPRPRPPVGAAGRPP